MGAYIVRVAETKELVGIFWADCTADLVDAVDEFIDAPTVEYAKLRPGGIFMSGRCLSVPSEKDDVLDASDWFIDPDRSESLIDAMETPAMRWHPFTTAPSYLLSKASKGL